jgi:hypothetical protein
MTKAQGRRSQKNKGRYKDRYNITDRNKARRAAKRAKLARKREAKKALA